MSLSTRALLSAVLGLGGVTAFGQQVNINFEAQCPGGVQGAGPCSTEFQFAGPAQTLNVPTSLGTVTFQGGILLDDATNLPADETAVYGTNTGGGYAQAITITFPTAVTNFYFTLINGVTQTEAYTVSDNAGHSSSFSVLANTSSGVQGTGFLTAGTVITITTTDLSFSTPLNSGGSLQQSIEVQNLGSGGLPFTASVVSGSSWVSISPTSGTASLGSPVPIAVTVNAAGLTAGSYRDVVRISSTFGNALVPVTVFVANAGPSITATPIGVLFNVVQGAGSSATQSINIADSGSPNTSVSWSAGPAMGTGLPTTDFVSFGSTSGLAQPGAPGALSLGVNDVASGLAPGVYYELVAISDQNSQNSPQYVTAVLNVVPAAASVLPQMTPGGLLFVGQIGRPIVPQQFTVNWSSSQPQVFQATALTAPGQTWLKVDSGGSATTNSSPLLTVSVNAAGLSAGVYSGSIALSGTATGTALGAVNVTLILAAAQAITDVSAHPTGPLPAVHRESGVAGCAPSAVVLTETGIPNNFSVPAGWPANLVATMTDDCGNGIEGGAVAANFSNGDAPLSLADQGSGGQYVATWQPSNLSNTIVTLYGTSGVLKPALAQLAGVVTANQAPVLNPNGVVDGFTFLAGGALAPGTVASAFGAGLATSKTPASPPTPLPTAYQSTQLIVGGFLTPLYYVSPTQLNVEIPAEIRALQQYPAVGVVNGALTLPVTVPVVPIAPGVAAFGDGSVIAQDSNFALVNAASPAHPGESIVIYLVGMGATNPAIASGKAAPGLNPGDTLASATVQPVVNVGNQTAKILFAGLTPGAIGLYQINFTVPSTVSAGSQSLTVSQGSVNANTTTLPVVVP
jgi:uncharacterized protein (TIGR03437 family)